MKNYLEELLEYRVKVERDGKEIVNIPGILCLPGLLAAPKMSLIGMAAAPLLGCSIRIENGEGQKVDVEKTAREAAKTIVDTARTTARTIKEEIDKAWDAASAEDEPGVQETAENKPEDAAAEDEPGDAEADREEPADDIPAVHEESDDSTK